MGKDLRARDSNLPETRGANRQASRREEERQDREEQGNSGADETHFTTVVIDVHGKVYDISKEHPSWELTKENKRKNKKKAYFERCIIKDAFTCTREECQRLKDQSRKRKQKK